MDRYQDPLVERYTSREMVAVFSPQFKHSTWRRLWLYLAKAQKELGVDICDDAIAEMEAALDTIDFEFAGNKEKELRHDVMAHIHAFAAAAPKAAPFIHLGATSCYVGDNTDLIQIKTAAVIIKNRLVSVMAALEKFCEARKELPCLGFTHYQPAQLTTVGKRGSLWLYDLYRDYEDLTRLIKDLPFRGVKGTTGTQASFLALLGDAQTVETLDRLVTESAGFKTRVPVSGQTYTRKIDTSVLNVLAQIASSASKFSCDMRLLQGQKEIEEPFGKNQVGSSAMAYKRNPMRSERITSLARFLGALALNPFMTHATQWLERSLDDSANRRLTISQAFMTADAILMIMHNVVSGLVVNEKVIEKHVLEELPFMATENILMASVQKGGDRQKLHEVIRALSMAAAANVKQKGLANNLIDLMKASTEIPLNSDEIDKIIEPKEFIGLAPQQVNRFLDDYIRPLLNQEAGNYETISLDISV